MAGIAESLNTHHAQLEAQLALVLGAARAADWQAYRATFAALRIALLDHIAYEDEELFPELARTPGNDAELHALRADHRLLRRHFDTLAAAAPEFDPEGCMGELDDLSSFLRKHHKRELAVCYPALDRLQRGAPALESGARALVATAQDAFETGPASPALDLRGLQPPEPIVRIIAALEKFPGQTLRAILPHEPVPLYALLRERGFRYSGEARPDGGYELIIESD